MHHFVRNDRIFSEIYLTNMLSTVDCCLITRKKTMTRYNSKNDAYNTSHLPLHSLVSHSYICTIYLCMDFISVFCCCHWIFCTIDISQTKRGFFFLNGKAHSHVHVRAQELQQKTGNDKWLSRFTYEWCIKLSLNTVPLASKATVSREDSSVVKNLFGIETSLNLWMNSS